MSALAKKEPIPAKTAPKAANVVRLARQPAPRINVRGVAMVAARSIVPPLVVLTIILTIWQVLCSSPDASLPLSAPGLAGKL